MQIPKKISPDSIKSSVVEVRYNSSLVFEVLLGFIYKSLDDSYYYTNRPIPKSQSPINPKNIVGQPKENALNIEQLFINQLSAQHLFYTDKVLITLNSNQIIFTCINEYLGWDDYFSEIKRTLKQLVEIKEIIEFTRIGIRYINEYPDIHLKNCANFDFTFGINSVTSQSYTFRSEFQYEKYKAILNLSSMVPNITQPLTTIPGNLISKIDTDIILENAKIKSYDELVSAIDNAHIKEKEIFFQVIKEEFLKTLNPIY